MHSKLDYLFTEQKMNVVWIKKQKKDILCNQFNCLHTILIICFLQVLFFVADKLNKSYQL